MKKTRKVTCFCGLFFWVLHGFAIVHTVFAWIYLRVLVGFTIPILAIFAHVHFLPSLIAKKINYSATTAIYDVSKPGR